MYISGRLIRENKMSIIYKKQIKEAYSGLPLLGLMDLQFGDLINTTPGNCHWWPPDELIGRIAATQIIKYQARAYWNRENDYIYSTHTRIHTFQGRFFEVTSPVAQYGRITEKNFDYNRLYIVCRYNDWYIRTAEEREIFYSVFNDLDGKKYDYGQLLAILVNQVMHWSSIDYLPIFDLSRKRKVCSVAARICWLKWWKKYAQPEGLVVRRPGGELNAERTPPAHFELCPTFRIAGLLTL